MVKMRLSALQNSETTKQTNISGKTGAENFRFESLFHVLKRCCYPACDSKLRTCMAYRNMWSHHKPLCNGRVFNFCADNTLPNTKYINDMTGTLRSYNNITCHTVALLRSLILIKCRPSPKFISTDNSVSFNIFCLTL